MVTAGLPSRLRWAITETFWSETKAQDLAAACVRMGLAPQDGVEGSPFSSKRGYVSARIQELDLSGLEDLARRVAAEYGDYHLGRVLDDLGARGVDGELKNLIFASTGPKPQMVWTDFLQHQIKIIKNGEQCLIYDRPLPERGLSWDDLVEWWKKVRSWDGVGNPAHGLYQRLLQSMPGSVAEYERRIFRAYCSLYGRVNGGGLPALIPQVYLHYDPRNQAHYGTDTGPLKRQRMDFLLLMPNNTPVVIEVDGRQHYADDAGTASSSRYAEMVREDRALRLAGYEVYRFGGYELKLEDEAAVAVSAFFDALLTRHGLSGADHAREDR